MGKGKMTNVQIMINKTLLRKLKIEQHKPHKKPGMLSSSYSTIRICLVRMKKTIAMLEQRDDTRTSKQFAGYNVLN